MTLTDREKLIQLISSLKMTQGMMKMSDEEFINDAKRAAFELVPSFTENDFANLIHDMALNEQDVISLLGFLASQEEEALENPERSDI